MGLSRRFVVLLGTLITVVWALAFTEGLSHRALVCALLSTGLSAALALAASVHDRPRPRAAVPLGSRRDLPEFRRELTQLCAGLKLAIDFCERHPDADPDAMLQHVEEMGDAIVVFVNQMARPVCLLRRADCAADRYHTDPSRS